MYTEDQEKFCQYYAVSEQQSDDSVVNRDVDAGMRKVDNSQDISGNTGNSSQAYDGGSQHCEIGAVAGKSNSVTNSSVEGDVRIQSFMSYSERFYFIPEDPYIFDLKEELFSSDDADPGDEKFVIKSLEQLSKECDSYIQRIKEANVSKEKLLVMCELEEKVQEKIQELELSTLDHKEDYCYGDIRKDMRYDFIYGLGSIIKKAKRSLSIIEFLEVIENTNLTEFKKYGYVSAKEAEIFLKNSKENLSLYKSEISSRSKGLVLETMEKIHGNVIIEIDTAMEAISKKKIEAIFDKKSEDIKEEINSLCVSLKNISTEARGKLPIMQFLLEIERMEDCYKEFYKDTGKDNARIKSIPIEQFSNFIGEVASCSRVKKCIESVTNSSRSSEFSEIIKINKQIKEKQSALSKLRYEIDHIEHDGKYIFMKSIPNLIDRPLKLVEELLDNTFGCAKKLLLCPKLKRSSALDSTSMMPSLFSREEFRFIDVPHVKPIVATSSASGRLKRKSSHTSMDVDEVFQTSVDSYKVMKKSMKELRVSSVSDENLSSSQTESTVSSDSELVATGIQSDAEVEKSNLSGREGYRRCFLGGRQIIHY